MDLLRRLLVLASVLFGITGGVASLYAKESEHKDAQHKDSQYVWTTEHMQVGVRWQPFVGRPGNNAYDAQRPVIAQDSSYVQFWMAWPALEPVSYTHLTLPTICSV